MLLTGTPGRWNPLMAWGLAVAKPRIMQNAPVAVAYKLGIVLHRMWRDETDFRSSTTVA